MTSEPRRAGWLVRRVWAPLKGTFYREVLLYEHPPDVTVPPPTLPVEIRALVPSDLDALAAVVGEEARAQAQSQLEAGDQGYLAWLDGEVVGVRWASRGEADVDYLDFTMPLAPDEAYAAGAYTVRRARGHGVGLALSERLLKDMGAAGCRRILGVAAVGNRGAQGINAATGQPVEVIRQWRLGPWRRTIRRPLP